jgi:pimeloyl-ACP methyl ester carboxylesterase
MRHEPAPSQDAEAQPFPLTPTPIHVPDEVLADLRRRLELTRWPDDAGNQDWYYGVHRAYLQQLVDYWRTDYDWRKAEARINAYEHYRVEVEGVPVHFMRRPGVGPNPTPLILTHGWPWTFWHWSKVVDPLADPAAHGGDPAQAFEVIVPSFPGFGFSTPLPDHPDMNFWKVADLWHTLMTGTLGYEKYAAGGCDVGALVTAQLGHKYAEELSGIHIGSGQKLTLFNGDRAWDLSGGRPIPSGLPAEVHAQIVALEKRFAVHLAAQVLAPSTLAYGLADSPAGMLAWILERWVNWSDNGGDVETVFTKDDLCTHATIYWVTNSIWVFSLARWIALPERGLAGHRWLRPDSEFDWSSTRMPSNSRCRATPPGSRRLAAWLERSLGPQPRSAGPRPPRVATGSGCSGDRRLACRNQTQTGWQGSTRTSRCSASRCWMDAAGGARWRRLPPHRRGSPRPWRCWTASSSRSGGSGWRDRPGLAAMSPRP